MATLAIVSVLVTRIDDLLLHLMGEEARHQFAGLREKLEKIRGHLETVQLCLETEDTSQRTKPVDELNEIICAVYTTEDCLDKLFLTTSKRKKRGLVKGYNFTFCDIAARTKVNDGIKQIGINSERISNMYKINMTPLRHSSVTRKTQFVSLYPNQRKTSSYYDIDGLNGFEDDLKTLESRLLVGKDGSDFRVISITGKPGIGKTTLAKAVFGAEDVKYNFDSRIWIYAGAQYNDSQFLDSILASIELKKDSLSMEQNIRRIYEFFKHKRYLIVLDDVWGLKPWFFLTEAIPDTRNGSRVLLTTRSTKIAQEADPASSPLEMKRLSDETSWRFLLQVCHLEESSLDEELVNLGKQIVNQCQGLPLAVQMMGGLLRRRTTSIDEWQKVFCHYNYVKDTGDNFLSDISQLIYDDLDFRLKPLFLYFFIFPVGYKISVRRLFGLWLSEDLVAWEDRARWEDLAHNFLSTLIGTNMIQVVRWKLDGKPKTCLMHNALREMFFSHCSNIGIHITRNNFHTSVSSYHHARRLVEYADINYDSSIPYHQTRSYISFNFRKGDVPAEVTGRFLNRVIKNGNFQLLRVLDLEGVYKPNLPESLGKLYMLRYLGLRWTFLESLPSSVGDLSYLETLDVKHTSISSLPSSILKLRKLQHLYLNKTHLNMPKGHLSVEKLHTLLGLSIDKGNPISKKLYSLTRIKRLGLSYQLGAADDIFIDWISKLNDLQTLRLRSISEYGQPSELEIGSFSGFPGLSDLHLVGRLSSPLSSYELPQNLTVLTLSVSRQTEDPMPVLEKLPKLRALRLFARSYTGKEMVCSNGGFPSLCIMKLWMLEELETWSVEEGAMVKLEELEVRCCKGLKEVPLELLQLKSLLDLILTNMSKAFIREAASRKRAHVRLTENNWEFPTFASQDQENSHEGESSEVPNRSQ